MIRTRQEDSDHEKDVKRNATRTRAGADIAEMRHPGRDLRVNLKGTYLVKKGEILMHFNL